MTTLRLLTWNVWGRNGDWRTREHAIAVTLARLDPDVVSIQEAWMAPEEGSQAVRLADRLQRHVVEAHPPPEAGDGRGLAVLSRWPIRAQAVHALPSGDAPDERRLAIHAEIATAVGNLHIYTTHLNWRVDHSHIRQAQVRRLLEIIAQSHDGLLPPVLSGDFNAIPASDEMRMLTGLTSVPIPNLVFQDAWDVGGDGGPGYTWSHRNPIAAKERFGNRRLDYVLVGWEPTRPSLVLRANVVDGDRPDGTWPSDHFGVLAELDLSLADPCAARTYPTPRSEPP